MIRYPKQVGLFRPERERLGLSGKEIANKMDLDAGFVSGCEHGKKLASRNFCTRYSRAVGRPDNHFWDLLHGPPPATVIDKLVAALIGQTIHSPCPPPAPQKPLRGPGMTRELRNEQEFGKALRELLTAEATHGKEGRVTAVWRAKTYLPSSVPNQVLRELVQDLLSRGCRVTHVVRHPDETEADDGAEEIDTALLLSVLSKAYSRYANYECKMGRFIGVSRRALDTYSSGRSGSIFAFSESPHKDPDKGIFIPHLARDGAVPTINLYSESIAAAAAPSVAFFPVEREARYYERIASETPPPGPSMVVRRFFDDATRPLADFQTDSPWVRRTIEYRRRERQDASYSDTHGDFLSVLRDRHTLERNFHERCSASSVRHIVCREAIEEWAQKHGSARPDNLAYSMPEAGPERAARLDKVRHLLETHRTFELAAFSRARFDRLPGMVDPAKNIDVGWFAQDGSTVGVIIADRSQKGRGGDGELDRLVYSRPAIYDLFSKVFDAHWSAEAGANDIIAKRDVIAWLEQVRTRITA